jgi:hypothetical protein
VQPNKGNIRLWVDALRSGEYRQASEALTNGEGYCCLGVACQISGLGKWEREANETEIHYAIGSDFDSDAYTLPRSVRRWLGVYTGNPEVDVGNTSEQLAHLNDSGEWNFHQIADAIERTYLAESA